MICHQLSRRLFSPFFLFFALMASNAMGALTVSMTGDTILNQGDGASHAYVVTITNTGAATAYDVGSTLTLPVPGASNGITHGAMNAWSLSSGPSGTAVVSRGGVDNNVLTATFTA